MKRKGEKTKGGKKTMRPSFKDFKKKALKKPEVEKVYNKLTPIYALKKQLIKMRTDAGLTQKELAEILGTKKGNISRLENVNSKNSPTLLTIEKYASAVGCNLQIKFTPKI